MNSRVRALCRVFVLATIVGSVPAADRVHGGLAAQAPPPAAEADLRDTLQRYSTALETLDVNAVRKVQPSIPAESLAKAFRDMRELDVTIDMVRVLSLDATTARVSCRVTQTLTPRAGAKQTTTVTRVMRLKRAAESWIIDGFER